jgi:hypothetical protein
MRWYKFIMICLLFSYCTNTDTVTETPSSDSSLKAIDPRGNKSDTERNFPDSLSVDTANRGLTH